MSPHTKNNRIVWIDVVRVIAILLVLFQHAYESSLLANLAVESMAANIGRMGVPLFIMISGALMFPKAQSYTLQSYYQKYLNRIIQFLLLLIGYTLTTNLIYIYIIKEGCINNTIVFLINNCGLPAKGVAGHMWYMRIITVLYILLPFLVKLIIPIRTRFVCLWLILCMLPIMNQSIHNIKPLAVLLPYVGYFILGYLINSRLNFKKSSIVVIISILALLTSMAMALFLDLWHNTLHQSLHWYSSSFTILISSTALFLIIREIYKKNYIGCSLITNLSICSFGIYLTHYPFLLVINHLIRNSCTVHINAGVLTTIYFILSLILSWLFTISLIRIPYLRKLVS